MLASMRFRDFVWPHNPRTFTAEHKRCLAQHKLPFGGFVVQDMGRQMKIYRGEGEFTGPGAYRSFARLADTFSKGGMGILSHPLWPPVTAYFASLRLRQSPRPDFVSYSFEFWEYGDGSGAESSTAGLGEVYITLEREDNLGAIAARYGLSLDEIRRLNPQFPSMNALKPGERVRVS